MSQSDIARTTRHTKRRRTLGPAARCERCGWDGLSALTKSEDGIRCYECACTDHGKSAIEAHHHLGQAVDAATVPIAGNIHRDLSDRQRDWPTVVRSNPQRDPLLWLAAAVFGLRDHLAWWIDWIDRIGTWLVAVATSLVERDGERWWESMGLAPLWQEVSA